MEFMAGWADGQVGDALDFVLSDEQLASLSRAVVEGGGKSVDLGPPDLDDGLKLNRLGISLVTWLAGGSVIAHLGPPGGGKSYQIGLGAAGLYGADHKVLIACLDLVLCRQTVEHLEKIVPEAFAAGHVAQVFG